jgi:hypothetical protein
MINYVLTFLADVLAVGLIDTLNLLAVISGKILPVFFFQIMPVLLLIIPKVFYLNKDDDTPRPSIAGSSISESIISFPPVVA